MSKRYSKNEFRFNFDTKHKQYIFEESNGKYRSLGITHEPITFGKKNMPLKNNPQRGKTDKAYIRNGIVSGSKKRYSTRTIKNLSFCKNDMANIKSKIRNYKKNRRKK